jgi:steroid delta-isomerase-like uncharacterized protein
MNAVLFSVSFLLLAMTDSDLLFQRLVEALNAHDIDGVVDCHATDFKGVDVSEAQPQSGLGSVRLSLARYLEAFPDLVYTPEEIISAGNSLAVVWNARGTHLGTWANIPPSGRPVTIRGISRLKVAEGKIIQTLTVWDVAGLLRAIGLLPHLT